MIGSRLIKSNDVAAGCEDIVDAYDPFGDSSGVALYQLNGNANDVSGNYNGTASNVTYGTGVFGQAGVFNGSTSQISFNNTGFPSTTMTVSAWIKPSSTFLANGISGIVAWGDTTVGERRSLVYYAGRQIGYSGAFASGNFTGTTVLPTEQWSHIAFTLTGGIVTLYINGAFEGSGTVAVNAYSSTTAYIGTTEAPNEHFNGSIDQVRIFNTALTPLEVEALYIEELCICGGTVDTLDILGDGSCIALYPLDGNANDLSGNYSGTPTNVSYGVGEFDLAGVFNGSSSYISGLNNVIPTTNTDCSFSCWFNMASSFSSNYKSILGGQGTDSLRVSLRYASSGNYKIEVARGKEGVLYYNDTFLTTPISLSTWYNLVVTYNHSNNTANVYLNNNLIDSVILSITLPHFINTNLLLGTYRNDVGFSFWNGSIDQVRIFNKALNSTEVTTLYNETACANTTRTAGVTQILGDSSCVAYYKLDGTADDETGSYNGVFTNPNYSNGEFDFAGDFNGVNNLITLPSSFSSTYEGAQFWSFSAWVNLGASVTSKTIFSKYNSSVQVGGIAISTNSSGNINFFVANLSDNRQVNNGNTVLSPNTWHNIVAVWSNGTMSIYLDGNAETLTNTFNTYTASAIPTTTTSEAKANLFASITFSTGSKVYSELKIDQVRVFNKAVSASEVTTLYDEGI